MKNDTIIKILVYFIFIAIIADIGLVLYDQYRKVEKNAEINNTNITKEVSCAKEEVNGIRNTKFNIYYRTYTLHNAVEIKFLNIYSAKDIVSYNSILEEIKNLSGWECIENSAEFNVTCQKRTIIDNEEKIVSFLKQDGYLCSSQS